jgi:hypothetical protein
VTVAAVLLLGGIVWAALGQDPAWSGWAIGAAGATWLLVEMRR